MKAILIAALASAAVVSAPAQALTFVGVYTSTDAPTAATISFSTADTLNALGGYDILAVGGHVGSDAISGLVVNPTQPVISISADGLFFYDNTVYPGAPAVSNAGVLFDGVSGTEYNLFSDSESVFELYTAVGGNYDIHSTGTFSIAAVPETASWAMMLAGFGAMGAMMRRRRTEISFA